MLTITIPKNEFFIPSTNSFVYIDETKLTLEHSLVSISKWEAKWHKPFITKKPKTLEETKDYVRCMTITQNVNPDVYLGINKEILKQVEDYMDNAMTATWFNDKENPVINQKEQITSELIYYWMISQNIPFECEKWHLNRLLTLIKVCGVKNTPPKKLSKKDVMSRNRALNAARKAKLNSRG